MKKLLLVGGFLLLVVIVLVPLLFYFFNRDESEKLSAGPDPTIEFQKFVNDTTITRIFRGILPCPDCEGVETVISLSQEEGVEQSGTFSLASTYFGTDRDAEISAGDWSIQQNEDESESLLVLNFDDGEAQSFKWIDDETLVKLDSDGSEFLVENDYILKLQ